MLLLILLISSINAYQFNDLFLYSNIIDNKIYLDNKNIIEINPLNNDNLNITYQIDKNDLHVNLHNLDAIIIIFTQPINNYLNIINVDNYQLILDDNELLHSVEVYRYYMYIYFVTDTTSSYHFVIKNAISMNIGTLYKYLI